MPGLARTHDVVSVQPQVAHLKLAAAINYHFGEPVVVLVDSRKIRRQVGKATN